MTNYTVIGLARIVLNLHRRHEQLGKDFERGAKRAGLLLMRESQQMVPVEYGALKNSAYTRMMGIRLGAKVYVGYTAPYALHVHELVQEKMRGIPRPSGQGKYWDPSPKAGSKFLEKPARALAPRLRQIILREMKI